MIDKINKAIQEKLKENPSDEFCQGMKFIDDIIQGEHKKGFNPEDFGFTCVFGRDLSNKNSKEHIKTIGVLKCKLVEFSPNHWSFELSKPRQTYGLSIGIDDNSGSLFKINSNLEAQIIFKALGII